MITLTESACKELDAYFDGKEKSPIRIYAVSSCSGQRLTLALDKPNEEDTTEEQSGYTFCINAGLLDQVKGVTIDLSYMGFTVEPSVPFANTGGGCGSCCSSCGSH